ncbi:MAG: hypothetical protein AAB400_01095 [Patescibacteria group bacterium]
MINVTKLTDIGFWLSIRPTPLSKAFALGFLLFFLLLIASKIALRVYAAQNKRQLTKADKKLYDLIQSLLLTMGSLGIIWTFFALEGIPILAARGWVLLWLLGLIIWIYVIVRFYMIEYTDFKVKLAERQRLEKYLPKKSGA